MHYKILTNEGSYNSYLAKSFRFRIIKHLLSTFHMMSSFSPQKCIHLRFLIIQKKISSLVGTVSTVTIGYIKIHFRFFNLAWETFSGLPFQHHSDHSPGCIPCDSCPDLISVPQNTLLSLAFGLLPCLFLCLLDLILPLNCHLFTEPNPNDLSGTSMNVVLLI